MNEGNQLLLRLKQIKLQKDWKKQLLLPVSFSPVEPACKFSSFFPIFIFLLMYYMKAPFELVTQAKHPRKLLKMY